MDHALGKIDYRKSSGTWRAASDAVQDTHPFETSDRDHGKKASVVYGRVDTDLETRTEKPREFSILRVTVY